MADYIETNADRIRAMSDEELAELFCEGTCPPDMTTAQCKERRRDTSCKDCWLDWLRSPADVTE